MKHKPDEREKHHFANTNYRVKNNPEQITKHHVPPKCPDATPKPKVLHKTRKMHEFYHALFGCPATYEEACYILRRDWWTDEQGNPITQSF